MNTQKFTKTIIAISCILATSFYFYETILETAPTAMLNGLMASFHIDGARVGFLDTAYFITYAILQIPGGALLDRLGARIVMPAAALCCYLGLLIFGMSTNYYTAMAGRIIAGTGGTFGLMGAMFVVSSWVNKRFLAFGLGLTMMFGLAGGLFNGVLVAAADRFGWRVEAIFLAFMALTIGLCIVFFLRDNPDRDRSASLNLVSNALTVLGRWRNWPIAIFGGLLYIPTGTLGSGWGVNFFESYYPHVAHTTAGNINAMLFLGWIIGSPIAGFISDQLHRRKLLLLWSSLFCIAILLSISQFDFIPLGTMFVLMFLLGFFSSFSGLTFAMGCENNPLRKGVTIGFINMIAIIPTIIITPLFGYILDQLWEGTMLNGARIFPLYAYQQAMILEYVIIGAAFVIAWLFIEEKKRDTAVE